MRHQDRRCKLDSRGRGEVGSGSGRTKLRHRRRNALKKLPRIREAVSRAHRQGLFEHRLHLV